MGMRAWGCVGHAGMGAWSCSRPRPVGGDGLLQPVGGDGRGSRWSPAKGGRFPAPVKGGEREGAGRAGSAVPRHAPEARPRATWCENLVSLRPCENKSPFSKLVWTEVETEESGTANNIPVRVTKGLGTTQVGRRGLAGGSRAWMMGDRRDSARAVSAAYRSLVGEDLSKLDVSKEKKQREWVWEYVLKFCPEQSLIRELVKVFPFPDDSLVLKRMLLLKTLAFNLAEPLLPERALDVLRGLADLGLGQPPGNDLLLAVMVELTVQNLREESLDFHRFSEALEKHWGPSVEDTEDRYQDDSGTLEATRQEFRAVLEKDSCREVVVRRYPREDMERMLTGYLDQSWAEIGPTFLETVEDENRTGFAQGNRAGTPINNAVEAGTTADNQGPADEQRTANAVSPNGEPAADADPLGVVQAIRELREREKHLYKAVKDPLPNALLLATQVQGMVQAARQDESGREAVHRKGGDGEMDLGNRVPNHHPNCIEEDISSPEEGISKTSRRVMLRRPSECHFSPLSPFDSPPQVKARRRIRHLWTDVEESTLRKEVAKYGKGRWKFILTNNMDVFTNRTEVDLKDKWRNIERSEG